MSGDASFADGAAAGPLRLLAVDVEDLQVVSALSQDAVFPVTAAKWDRRRRRFSILINRFRWEDQPATKSARRPFERVQSVLHIEYVQAAATDGLDLSDRDAVLSLLSVSFEEGEDGAGRVILTLAGDGAIGLEVECLEVGLRDVTRPYVAPSGKAPAHPVED